MVGGFGNLVADVVNSRERKSRKIDSVDDGRTRKVEHVHEIRGCCRDYGAYRGARFVRDGKVSEDEVVLVSCQEPCRLAGRDWRCDGLRGGGQCAAARIALHKFHFARVVQVKLGDEILPVHVLDDDYVCVGDIDDGANLRA